MTKKYIYHDDIGFVELIDHQGLQAALSVVNSARISFGKKKEEFDEKDQKLAKFLWDNTHSSPFRHTHFTFCIKLPLFVKNQLLKYQVGSSFREYVVDDKTVTIEVFDEFFDIDKGCSWNEQSGRYQKFEAEFFIPKEIRSQDAINKQSSVVNPDLVEYVEDIRDVSMDLYRQYEYYISKGICREQARMILPGNLYTCVYWTVSLQAVLWFLHQRLKPDAQEEIRLLA